MTAEVPPLIEILAEIPDPRQPSGKRYPLGAMLNVVVGCDARWVQKYSSNQ